MTCPNCNKHDANYSPTFGVLPCDFCNSIQKTPSKTVEFTTEQIKGDRKQFSKEMLAPFREGQLSKEYINEYGTKNLKVTKEEIIGAKEVWKDLKYYD